MKTTVRYGVFETNSSSTHTLALVGKFDYDKDKPHKKSKGGNYGVIDNVEDKLLMAVGCCDELFVTEEEMTRNASYGDAISIEYKEKHDEIKRFIANGFGNAVYMWHYVVTFEMAVSYLVKVYCEITKDDYDAKYAEIMEKSKKYYLHTEFFDNGALYDPNWDYQLIDDMFNGDEDKVLNNIREYFSDEWLLTYAEYYNGIHWDDDK